MSLKNFKRQDYHLLLHKKCMKINRIKSTYLIFTKIFRHLKILRRAFASTNTNEIARTCVSCPFRTENVTRERNIFASHIPPELERKIDRPRPQFPSVPDRSQ